MRVYTLHYPATADVLQDDPVVIKEGFNWPAAFLTFLWALWNGMWLAALLVFLAGAAMGVAFDLAGASDPVRFAAGVGLSLIVGFCGNDWRRAKLRRRGYRFQGLIAADNADAARRRWFSLHPPGAAAGAGY